MCFDSGGLNLKPTNFIEDMHLDMGGAAAALAATSFFPWSYAVALTGGLVNYIQFPWRLLALTAALLALAAAYPIAGMQGEHQKLAVVLALAPMWKKTEWPAASASART